MALNNLKAKLTVELEQPKFEQVGFDIESFDAGMKLASLDMENLSEEIRMSETLVGQLGDILVDLESITDYDEQAQLFTTKSIRNVGEIIGLDLEALEGDFIPGNKKSKSKGKGKVDESVTITLTKKEKEEEKEQDSGKLKKFISKILDAIAKFFNTLVIKAKEFWNQLTQAIELLQNACYHKVNGGMRDGKPVDNNVTLSSSIAKAFTIDGKNKFGDWPNVFGNIESPESIIGMASKILAVDADDLINEGKAIVKHYQDNGKDEIKDTFLGKRPNTKYLVQSYTSGNRMTVCTVGWKDYKGEDILSTMNRTTVDVDPKAKYDEFKEPSLRYKETRDAYLELNLLINKIRLDLNKRREEIFKPAKDVGKQLKDKSFLKILDVDLFNKFKAAMLATQQYAGGSATVFQAFSGTTIGTLKARYKYLEACEKNLKK